ncbi:MAG: hypothetical protein QNJ40_22810 [Xanthomonadales bacterium]|nr:hypothetical protein [Xanthomonadales bacterium]
MSNRTPAAVICTAILTALPLLAQAADRHSITVYSRTQPGAVNPSTFEAQANNPDFRINIPGYAMVRTVRSMELVRGTSRLRFSDVAAGIDPTTVAVKSLTDPDGTRVLEQNYQYDLVSTERMMDRFLGQEISIAQVLGDSTQEVTGRLVASNRGDLVLSLADGRLISLGRGTRNVYFPNLPDGLITRPTLDWSVNADRGGDHDIQVSYETRGMTWWADYNLTLDESRGCKLDVNPWVTIVNQSGGSFEEATLKLIAGDVNRAPQASLLPRSRVGVMETAMMDSAGFAEESFFEYHLYTLGRPATLRDRSIKQLELFPAALGVSCDKTLVFDAGYRTWGRYGQPLTSTQSPFPPTSDVKVFLQFENDRDNGLGMPLPAGRLRVSQVNPNDGNLEFIGEDIIDHTPRNERISAKLGNAFDVVGERKQANFRWDRNDSWMEETIEVKIRNQKEEPVTVSVWESLIRWSNWQIQNNSHDFEKRDASSISFELTIDPEQEEVLTYTARYDW